MIRRGEFVTSVPPSVRTIDNSSKNRDNWIILDTHGEVDIADAHYRTTAKITKCHSKKTYKMPNKNMSKLECGTENHSMKGHLWVENF